MAAKFSEEEEFEFALAHEKELSSSTVPRSLAGKALETTKGFAPFPFKTFEAGKTPAERVLDFTYQGLGFTSNPVQRLEEAGQRVKGVAQSSIGNVVSSAPPGFLGRAGGDIYQDVKRMAGGSMAAGVALSPFTPSEFAGAIAGTLPMPGLPFLKNPETEVGNLAEELAGPRVTQPQAGQEIKESYSPVAEGLGKIQRQLESTGGKAAEIEAERTKVFPTELTKTQERFGTEPVSQLELGKKASSSFQKILGEKRSAEESAWKDVASYHPASNESDTIEYIENLLTSKGSYEIPDIPRELIKNILPEEEEITYGKFTPRNVSAENKPLPYVQKILVDLKRPDLTFNDLKQIRTEVGSKIDWNAPRTDEAQYHLKNVYKSLTGDMERTAEEGGFVGEAKAAFQSTKDVYKFLEQPSSEVILRNVKQPEKILDGLIQSNSPTKVGEIMKQYDPETQNALRRAFLDKLSDKAKGDPDAFSKIYSGYTKETREALFGEHSPLVDSLGRFTKKLYRASEILPEVPKFETLLGEKNVGLNNLIQKTDASDLIEKISGGSVENVQMVVKVLDGKGKDILWRGFLHRILDKARITTPGGYIYDNTVIAKELKGYSPEFFDALFGEKASIPKTLKDISVHTARNLKGDLWYQIDRTVQYKHLGFMDRLLNRLKTPGQINRMTQEGLGRPLFKERVPSRVPLPYRAATVKDENQ